jgi:hypothetical protein
MPHMAAGIDVGPMVIITIITHRLPCTENNTELVPDDDIIIHHVSK